VNIEIHNTQSLLDIDKNSLQNLVKTVLCEEKVRCDQISIHFVETKRISELHNEFFNDPSTTDCITFPIDDPSEVTDYLVLGEVFVCPETAINYCKDNSETEPYEETSLYVVHGILHLLGYDDIDESDRVQMRAAETHHISILKEKDFLLKPSK
jgi:probable rRNA maturation factor